MLRIFRCGDVHIFRGRRRLGGDIRGAAWVHTARSGAFRGNVSARSTARAGLLLRGRHQDSAAVGSAEQAARGGDTGGGVRGEFSSGVSFAHGGSAGILRGERGARGFQYAAVRAFRRWQAGGAVFQGGRAAGVGVGMFRGDIRAGGVLGADKPGGASGADIRGDLGSGNAMSKCKKTIKALDGRKKL